MGWFLLYIVGITFLILAMAFRSVVVAAKAAATTMLSAAAAFGALTAVFEWGWFGSFIGLDVTGPTESFIPMIVLSILFGLSMDYEVFLVSRIREEYVRSGDARAAVRTGVGAIGKVIVAAGIIMGVVFWAFVLGDDRTVKAFGVGLGVAILVDALIVRMVLVPAVMHLLGRHAWYIPRWLDRALPGIDHRARRARRGSPRRSTRPRRTGTATGSPSPSADPTREPWTGWPARRPRTPCGPPAICRGVPMNRFHDLLADEICEAELRAQALDRAGTSDLADWWRRRGEASVLPGGRAAPAVRALARPIAGQTPALSALQRTG